MILWATHTAVLELMKPMGLNCGCTCLGPVPHSLLCERLSWQKELFTALEKIYVWDRTWLCKFPTVRYVKIHPYRHTLCLLGLKEVPQATFQRLLGVPYAPGKRLHLTDTVQAQDSPCGHFLIPWVNWHSQAKKLSPCPTFSRVDNWLDRECLSTAGSHRSTDKLSWAISAPE